MKADVHPKYNPAAQVVCSCGNMFTVGSTKDVIHVELCYRCHPFYTGQQKFVDTASRIEKFQQKIQVASQAQSKKQEKKRSERKEDSQPRTLREMLQSIEK